MIISNIIWNKLNSYEQVVEGHYFSFSNLDLESLLNIMD